MMAKLAGQLTATSHRSVWILDRGENSMATIMRQFFPNRNKLVRPRVGIEELSCKVIIIDLLRHSPRAGEA